MTPHYRVALDAALSLPGNILSATPDARWARLVWTCCAAAGGCWERAVPLAAAVEIFMVGLDILDDAEDGEASPLQAGVGPAGALNVSTGLLLLAQQALLATDDGAAAAGILLDAGLQACSGQHADVTMTPGRQVGLDEALAVTACKSASLVAAICRLGAFAAGADAPTQQRYVRFGQHLGMVLQLSNDIAALRPGAAGKTDVALGRPTLPLACAALSRRATDADTHGSEAHVDLWMGGPAHLAWVVAETHRRHAAALIPQLTTERACRAALAGVLEAR